MPEFQLKAAEVIKPKRMAVDYSEKEVVAFQARFKGRAREFRRWKRFFFGSLGVAVTIAVIGPWLGFARPEYVFFPLGFVLIVSCLSILWRPQLICPACRNHLESHFGPHCPQCGKPGLVPADNRDFPFCEVCGDLGRLKGDRMYKIRFCSCCGIPVDSSGL